MNKELPDGRNLDTELVFIASRSSGPGGQNVNKVSTKIELRFDVYASVILNENEKSMIFEKLKNKISREGVLIISSQSARSQLENKENAIDKFYRIIGKALIPQKSRKKTLPTNASRIKRMEVKQIVARKKAQRKPPMEE